MAGQLAPCAFIRRTGTLARRPLAGQTPGGRLGRALATLVLWSPSCRALSSRAGGLLLSALAALAVQLAWVWLEPATWPSPRQHVADLELHVLPSPEVGFCAAQAARFIFHPPLYLYLVGVTSIPGNFSLLRYAQAVLATLRLLALRLLCLGRPPACAQARPSAWALAAAWAAFLPELHLVGLAFLGRDRVTVPAVVEFERLAAADEGRLLARGARCRRLLRARDPDPRDGALLACRSPPVRLAWRRARRRARPPPSSVSAALVVVPWTGRSATGWRSTPSCPFRRPAPPSTSWQGNARVSRQQVYEEYAPRPPAE